ncbi:MAG: phosphoribosylaminoimidazolesuccinocarboxamide synthase [Deltaproteobacteria bacterium]|nr:MAG: phosphoribosylaminoimidazolesuccinocarboxamide synthase [Deltaproteobacteria bacterium]
MEARELVYEGKAKKLFATGDPDLLLQYFKDDATAFNAKKRGTIIEKGVRNNAISEVFFRLLEREGVPTHFVRRLDDRHMLVKRLEIVPVEMVVRNVIAGSLAKRLGIEEGKALPEPIVEFYYKSDALDDPMINEWHVRVLGMATQAEIDRMVELTLKVNAVLRPFVAERGIVLVDMKLEFGRHHGTIILGDEICPDTCRFWDSSSGEKLDKDRFRRDLGRVEEAYEEIARRVGA